MLSLLVYILTFQGQQFIHGAVDPACKTSDSIICPCCKDQKCRSYFVFQDGCPVGCIDGHRGVRCWELCENNCKTCPSRKTECSTCYDGLFLDINKICVKCPVTCKTCTLDSICGSCKEGFENRNGSTACEYSLCSGNCICNNTKCISCKNRYFDTVNSCNKTCPGHCEACTSLQTCSECSDGYYNGHKIVNGNNITLNNCTHGCRETCVRCSSYDQCVLCGDGKYGVHCHNNCSIGCKDGKCKLSTGNCDCSENFVGEKCDTCSTGKYGDQCNMSCSLHCLHGRCDISDGKCSDGCISNFSGDRCCAESRHCLYCKSNTECKTCTPGFFGHFCEKTCPVNCSGSCDIESGVCTDCKKNLFGEFCNFSCSNQCYISEEISESRCASSSGTCIFGCEDGTFGLTCNEKCSSQCIENVCIQASGICSKGCKLPKADDLTCALSSGQQGRVDEESERNKYAVVVALGSLLAISIVVHVSVVALCVMKKIKISRRLENDHAYENQMATLERQVVEPKENETEVTQTEASKTYVYEGIRRGIEQEHEYQQVAFDEGN